MTSDTRAIPARHELLLALGLTLGPLVGQGFSRFAYALLLPPMRADLGWNFTQAGGLNSANAIGYIAGAATAALVARRVGMRLLFGVSFAICAVLLLAMSLTGNYTALAVTRAASGVFIAMSYVAGTGLSSRLSPVLRAMYFSGPGMGIALSGLVVPAALADGNPHAWRTGWLLLGGVSLLLLIPAILAAKSSTAPVSAHGGQVPVGDYRHLLPTLANYTLFGAGYASYMTFVIALLRSQKEAAGVAPLFWIVLGLASAIGTPCWEPLLMRLRGGQGTALVAAAIFLGTLPVLFHPSVPLILVSGLIFGASFMASVTSVLGVVRRELPAERCTTAFAALTTGFALGQIVGPIISGWVSDATHSLSAGLWISPILLILAAMVALFQKERPRQTA